jgi:hypothetical protein
VHQWRLLRLGACPLNNFPHLPKSLLMSVEISSGVLTEADAKVAAGLNGSFL